MNVKLKKILSCFLIMLLLFNALFSCVVYADEHGGSSGDLDVTPSITIPPSPPDPAEFLIRMILPDGGEAIDYVSDWLEKRWKTDDDRQKDYSVSDDGSTVHLHKQFVDDLNKAVQDKIHALDGYYLYEPAFSNKYLSIPSVKSHFLDYCKTFDPNGTGKQSVYVKSNAFDTDFSAFIDDSACAVFSPLYFNAKLVSQYCPFYIRKSCSGFDSSNYLAFDSSGNVYLYNKKDGIAKPSRFYILRIDINYPSDSSPEFTWWEDVDSNIKTYIESSLKSCYGSPFRIFYSKEDLQNFWNKGRTYAPQLPSTTISIPIKYINNSVSLPDITYNINTTNKTT